MKKTSKVILGLSYIDGLELSGEELERLISELDDLIPNEQDNG